jgi:hypothetical protein
MLEADEAFDLDGTEDEASLVLTPAPRQLPPPVSPPVPPASGGEEKDYFSIVDVPGTEEASAWDEDYYGDFPEDRETELAGADDDEDSPEKTLYPIWAQGGSVGAPVSPGPPPNSVPALAGERAPAQPGVPVQPGVPAETAGELQAQLTARSDGTGSWASAWVTSPQSQVEPPPPGAYDYSLVPAEQRPPVDPGTYVIPPEAQIGPITQDAPAQPPKRPEPVIDESLFIESIENRRERTLVQAPPPPAPVIHVVPEAAAAPAAPRETLPEPVLAEPFPAAPLPEPVIIVEEPPLPESAPSPAPKTAPRPEPAAGKFSIPVIGEPEKGKYYLQLGAYSKPDALESSVEKLDRRFPLSVQSAGSAESPLYRLLLGPVNLGESGALLQRFKGSGYSDAFVRSY